MFAQGTFKKKQSSREENAQNIFRKKQHGAKITTSWRGKNAIVSRTKQRRAKLHVDKSPHFFRRIVKCYPVFPKSRVKSILFILRHII
mmetsp:Transcript_3816/g.16731  ORF Transcript_3816/g.16731 Transcript_3816/m.16731 type:complete len:88 (-) Transcript_3816:1889-2152(-)